MTRFSLRIFHCCPSSLVAWLRSFWRVSRDWLGRGRIRLDRLGRRYWTFHRWSISWLWASREHDQRARLEIGRQDLRSHTPSLFSSVAPSGTQGLCSLWLFDRRPSKNQKLEWPRPGDKWAKLGQSGRLLPIKQAYLMRIRFESWQSYWEAYRRQNKHLIKWPLTAREASKLSCLVDSSKDDSRDKVQGRKG